MKIAPTWFKNVVDIQWPYYLLANNFSQLQSSIAKFEPTFKDATW